MNPCTPEQAAGADVAIRKGMGQHIPDDMVQEGMPFASQLTYAKHTGTIMDHAVADVIDTDKHLPPSIIGKALRKIGVVDSWIAENLDPQDYLGRNYTAPLLDALQQHREGSGDFKAYAQNVAPIVDHLQSIIQDRFNGDHARINYANQWLDYWKDGGSFYPDKTNQGAIAKAIDTTVGNLIAGNPFIAVAHTMQIAPKAVAIYGPGAALKGMADWMGNVAQSRTLNIPDLVQKGALHAPGKFNPLLPFDGIVNFGDSIARGLSYHIAEAAKAGTGMEGVHNIAYAWQPGREPMVLWNKQSAMQVALQRYAISGVKMYGGWIRNVYDGARTGDLGMAAKGATALASFSLMQSLFTGVKSTIPAPIYPLLSQDAKDQIEQMDQAWPHITAAFGRDMGVHYQPMGGIGLGVAANLVNEDFKGGYSATKQAIQAYGNGDYARAGVAMTKAGLVYAQPLIPGARLTYKKLWDAVSPAILGDSDWSDVPEAAAKKLGFPGVSQQ